MSNIFINAEQRIYDYIDNVAQGLSGSPGQWPRKSSEVDSKRPDDLADWYVAITGASDNINPMLVAGNTPQAVAIAAEIKGRFANRKTALWFAGVLAESLPASINNVNHFGPQDDSVPVISETVLTVGETGYELNGWMVELDCLAVISRVDEPDIA